MKNRRRKRKKRKKRLDTQGRERVAWSSPMADGAMGVHCYVYGGNSPCSDEQLKVYFDEMVDDIIGNNIRNELIIVLLVSNPKVSVDRYRSVQEVLEMEMKHQSNCVVTLTGTGCDEGSDSADIGGIPTSLGVLFNFKSAVGFVALAKLANMKEGAEFDARFVGGSLQAFMKEASLEEKKRMVQVYSDLSRGVDEAPASYSVYYSVN